MASITIRNLDDDVKLRLRTRAAGNGRSMEEEVRLILRESRRPGARIRELGEFRSRVLCSLRRSRTRTAAA